MILYAQVTHFEVINQKVKRLSNVGRHIDSRITYDGSIAEHRRITASGLADFNCLRYCWRTPNQAARVSNLDVRVGAKGIEFIQ